MSKPTDKARLVLASGSDRTVTRDQVLQAIVEFDRRGLRQKATVGDSKKGWSLQENGKKYNPKWVLKLATDTSLGKFHTEQATETLKTLGFQLQFDQDWKRKIGESHDPLSVDHEMDEIEKGDELTLDLERNLQRALRANIEQLEPGLKITDGGKEKRVEYRAQNEATEWGQVDITAEDSQGALVLIELKAGRAGRRAIGQILGYMGVLTDGNKHIRGILVAEEFSPQAIAAARVVPNLQLREYTFKFSFEIAGAKLSARAVAT